LGADGHDFGFDRTARQNILPLVVKANEARNLRVPTSKLNRFFEDNISQPKGGSAPSPGKAAFARLKVQYITQGGLRPPLFVLFTAGGDKGGLHFSYLRYIENRLREEFEFFATPIRLKGKHKINKKNEKNKNRIGTLRNASSNFLKNWQNFVRDIINRGNRNGNHTSFYPSISFRRFRGRRNRKTA
jgi:hypothetical protein